ncbi:hypothetical protein AKJ44_02460 [candidate division MSBL1 archaeon SCGC-AAA261F17]|uniref:Uncharacterized protein n=1 Tax=candidate division MSBL1 archaeon SCGC-AAA261F17 TaxID=1698274 RepID=A0A133V509_9EURY|nr:hypothetical protein AKJ44_02460 [candidate division MSBL1 archaeon SCGC-AAA261F17]
MPTLSIYGDEIAVAFSYTRDPDTSKKKILLSLPHLESLSHWIVEEEEDFSVVPSRNPIVFDGSIAETLGAVNTGSGVVIKSLDEYGTVREYPLDLGAGEEAVRIVNVMDQYGDSEFYDESFLLVTKGQSGDEGKIRRATWALQTETSGETKAPFLNPLTLMAISGILILGGIILLILGIKK